MQNCSHCGMMLLIGISGHLVENGTNSPDIRCENCGQINEPRKAAYSEPSEMECDMCGKIGGVRDRGDGHWMCGSCWQAWNS